MKKYNVRIPFTGHCDVEVTAESKEEAEKIAREKVDIEKNLAEIHYGFCVSPLCVVESEEQYELKNKS